MEAGALYINTESIARELDSVQRMPTEHLMTGWFSGMDEYVLKLLEAYPQLGPAHSRFSRARFGIEPHSLTDATWSEMQESARELAAAVRALGNINIELCDRPTEYSQECGHALVNGVCALDWHTGTVSSARPGAPQPARTRPAQAGPARPPVH